MVDCSSQPPPPPPPAIPNTFQVYVGPNNDCATSSVPDVAISSFPSGTCTGVNNLGLVVTCFGNTSSSAWQVEESVLSSVGNCGAAFSVIKGVGATCVSRSPDISFFVDCTGTVGFATATCFSLDGLVTLQSGAVVRCV